MEELHRIGEREEVLILQKLREGYSFTSACEQAGYSRVSVWRYRQSHPDFNEACNEAYIDGTAFYEDKMRDKAIHPQGFLANAMILKRRDPAWRELQPKDVAGPTFNITINAPTPQELKDIMEGDYRLLPDGREDE